MSTTADPRDMAGHADDHSGALRGMLGRVYLNLVGRTLPDAHGTARLRAELPGCDDALPTEDAVRDYVVTLPEYKARYGRLVDEYLRSEGKVIPDDGRRVLAERFARVPGYTPERLMEDILCGAYAEAAPVAAVAAVAPVAADSIQRRVLFARRWHGVTGRRMDVAEFARLYYEFPEMSDSEMLRRGRACDDVLEKACGRPKAFRSTTSACTWTAPSLWTSTSTLTTLTISTSATSMPSCAARRTPG